jgi:hypothetical protein
MTLHVHVSDGAGSIEQAFDAASGPPGRRRRTVLRPSVHVWLTGALARPFLFGPVAGLKGWREAHSAASLIAPANTGLQGPCVACLEASPLVEAVLATAVDDSVLDALYDAAKMRGLRIASIRPAWGCAVNAWPRYAEKDGLLVCGEADAVTVIAMRDGSATFAATYAPAPALAELDKLLVRLQASLGFGASATLQSAIAPAVLGVQPTVRWLQQLEALQP